MPPCFFSRCRSAWLGSARFGSFLGGSPCGSRPCGMPSIPCSASPSIASDGSAASRVPKAPFKTSLALVSKPCGLWSPTRPESLFHLPTDYLLGGALFHLSRLRALRLLRAAFKFWEPVAQSDPPTRYAIGSRILRYLTGFVSCEKSVQGGKDAKFMPRTAPRGLIRAKISTSNFA